MQSWLIYPLVAAAVLAVPAGLSAQGASTARGAPSGAGVASPAPREPYDVIVEGGMIIDGTGNPYYRADVGIRGGWIERVGNLAGAQAARRIDARGLVVAPGFIDPHSHAVGGLFEIPTAESYLLQGITTVVDGNDGSSPLPIGEFLDRVDRERVSPNVALYVGHGTIRREVMGTAARAPTAAELERMKQMVATAMEEGALGLSTGLAYVPGNYARTEEIIELSRVAARHGGIYISHMRDEGGRVLESVKETIRIGEEAGIPVQMTHHKIGGRKQFGQSVQSIALMREARARGVDITFDQYPYTASSTGLGFIFPKWALAEDKLAERLADPAQWERVKEGMRAFIDERFGNDPSRLQFVRCEGDPSLAGKTMADLLRQRGLPLTRDAMVEMVIELQLRGSCGVILHSYDEADVERLLQSPYGMIGSDGRLTPFGSGSPHPRAYGTYPRILGRYVRERGTITLEEAVRKMTSFPANRLGLKDRGILREGLAADIAVFDPATTTDRATFTNPHQYSEGMRYVLVNGQLVIDGGRHTGARPGRALHGRTKQEST